MPSRPVVAIVDAYSTSRHLAPMFNERGYDCIHVQSTIEQPAPAAPSFRGETFVANIIHRGDLDETVAAIREYDPVALIAGMEIGVELADTLSETLGLRTNGTAQSTARRNKFDMVETVKAAGLPAAEQVMATDWDTLSAWYERVGGKVVLKPITSLGNDGVYFCDNIDEVREGFEALVNSTNVLGVPRDGVVAQEYLVGSEYYVNTVSLDGVHHVCDIWWTERMNINGVLDLQSSCHLLPRRGPEQNALVEYALGVLDALGIRNGAAHTELKLTPNGPRLIETGARACGGDLPVLAAKGIGEAQLEWSVDAAVDPERFKARCYDDYEIDKHVICMHMCSPKAGKLVGYPKLPQIEAMETFHEALTFAKPGGRVPETTNDWTFPMLVHFVHEVQSHVRRDYGTARYLDGEGFYELAPDDNA